MVEVPTPKRNRIEITDEFEFETYVSKEELIKFLKGIVEQLEAGNEITLSSEEWEVKFDFTEPIEIEIEYERDKKKLKIEVEFRQHSKIKA